MFTSTSTIRVSSRFSGKFRVNTWQFKAVGTGKNLKEQIGKPDFFQTLKKKLTKKQNKKKKPHKYLRFNFSHLVSRKRTDIL
jgi:hypothetical protein